MSMVTEFPISRWANAPPMEILMALRDLARRRMLGECF